MEFERVLNGVIKYINKEIYSGMNDWQEVLARVAVSRMIGNGEALKQSLISNSFFRTFAIIDDKGNVDLEGLVKDLKKQIDQKGHVKIDFPLLGSFTFTSADVDKIYNTILEG